MSNDRNTGRSSISRDDLLSLIETVGTSQPFKRGDILFKQGDQDFTFYYIAEGSVDLQFDGQTRRTLQEGDFFGEIRILGALPRTATAVCLTKGRLVKLSQEVFKDLLEKNPDFKKMIFAKYSARLLHFRTRQDKSMIMLKDSDYAEILKHFQPQSLKKEELLFSQGDKSDKIYIVLKGSLEILLDGIRIDRQFPGDFVGEIGVLYKIPRTATVRAIEDSELLSCDSRELEQVLHQYRPLHQFLQNLAIHRLSSGPASRFQFFKWL